MRRNIFFFSALALVLSGGVSAMAISDSTGLPGDHFSLEGALELFKTSSSPEDFEKKLNSQDGKVNNLDLNGDNEIDYLRVIDNGDKDVHALVIQAIVNESESQDVAVIEIEKNGSESATLQILGDEELYGEQKIAEPKELSDVQQSQPKKKGPSVSLVHPGKIVVNVWLWPSVRHIYTPGYVVWVSPWKWRAYPAWWKPWRPHRWRHHHAMVAPFRVHHHIVKTHRVVKAHNIYHPHRRVSVVVRERHKAAHQRHAAHHKNAGGNNQKVNKGAKVNNAGKANKVNKPSNGGKGQGAKRQGGGGGKKGGGGGKGKR